MNINDELNFLQEIEDSQEPVFGLLPDYISYDQNLNLIVNPLDNKHQLKWASTEFEAMIKYAEMDNFSYGKFLKPILPHIEFEGKILFDYIQLKEFGQRGDKLKFFI